MVVSSDENSSGSLIANNQVGDLELTYERYVDIANRWNSVSCPVTGVNVGEFMGSNDIRVRPSNTDQRYLNMYDHINAKEEQILMKILFTITQQINLFLIILFFLPKMH